MVGVLGGRPGLAVGIVLGGRPGLAVGIVLGAIIGSQLGPPTEADPEPQALAGKLRAPLPPSSSASVMIGAARDVDEILAARRRRRGT